MKLVANKDNETNSVGREEADKSGSGGEAGSAKGQEAVTPFVASCFM
jgi:hypothetical protein